MAGDTVVARLSGGGCRGVSHSQATIENFKKNIVENFCDKFNYNYLRKFN